MPAVAPSPRECSNSPPNWYSHSREFGKIALTTYGISRLPWPARTPQHRWYGLERYYAMFPAPFVTRAVRELTVRGDVVMDPFSGRGNAPYLAAAMGRPCVAVDILPVAWLFTAAKLDPSPNVDRVLTRLKDIWRAVRPNDRNSRSEFEGMAWAPAVRGFLRAARRELDWRGSRSDRTLAAFIALHMQDSNPNGLSNRLSPTVAHSPSYAVRWWTQRGFLKPPQTDPVSFLADRIQRRYAFGIPDLAHCSTHLGDARIELQEMPQRNVKLMITSPPYCDVTDYWNDQWIRLWLLGETMGKNWKKEQKHSNPTAYRTLIDSVFAQAKRHVREDGIVIVRCGDKPSTAETCRRAIRSTWPSWDVFEKRTEVQRRGTASGYGHGAKVICELDIAATSKEHFNKTRSWAGGSPLGV